MFSQGVDAMKNSPETQQHTVAEHGDVNVIPYPFPCTIHSPPRSRQLSPTPQVPPLVPESERK
jgi:hypothetical protein